MTPKDLAERWIKVAPLVWEDLEDQAIARAPIGHYVADIYMNGGRAELIVGWPKSGMMVVWRHDATRTTIGILKAAAEADHIARVCAMLEVVDNA